MKLTRKVLIEKNVLRFTTYNRPKDVPDEIWAIALMEINKLEKEDILDYIAGNILFPLKQIYKHSVITPYKITEIKNHLSTHSNLYVQYVEIIFYNSWTYRVYIELLDELTLNVMKYDETYYYVLKEVVCLIWESGRFTGIKNIYLDFPLNI